MLFGYIDPGSGIVIVSAAGWIIAILAGLFGLLPFFFKRVLRFFKNHWKLLVTILLILIALALTVAGVMMSKKPSDFDRKIIILGFDGLSPKIVGSMMEAGQLPNFARLKQQGSFKELLTTNPSQSPVAWTGFATGQNPGKHGVFDFIQRNPETMGLALSLSSIERGKPRRVVKSKCFWEYTSEQRVPTVIITCPVTFPPTKVYGRMLSGMGVPDILGTEGTFSYYTSEATSGKKDVGGNVFNVKKSSVIVTNLTGPKVASGKGKAKNVEVPLKIFVPEGEDSITIAYQDNKFELRKGQWSNWKEITFKVGFFKKAKGLLKFYLVETNPEFKLYVTPIEFDPRDPFFQISYPKSYAKELAENVGLYHSRGMPMDTWAVNEKRLTEEPFLQQCNDIFVHKKAILDFELNRFEKGVLYCYFESSDIVQHMFWRYTDTEHPLYEQNAPKEYKEVIGRWYKKMDETLGDVMDGLAEADTLIVMSDHGFGTFRRAAHINTWLRTNDYLQLKDSYAESGRELLSDIDWSSTKAYAIGFGAIYINQKGRERYGIVNPGKETEALKQEIAQKLKQWRDEKYNLPVVSNVYSRQELFWGDFANQTPDLYVGFSASYRASWQTALGAVPEKLIEDNLKKWSGSHLFDPNLIPGIIFCNRQIIKENPSIYDIAPTILGIIGFDDGQLKECNFDGSPLFYQR